MRSPLLPVYFFPYCFPLVYVYVQGNDVGERQDVGLVSYQKDTGVWIFLR